MAHEPRHVENFMTAAGPVFEEIVEAIDRNDVMRRIAGLEKHTMFARLTPSD